MLGCEESNWGNEKGGHRARLFGLEPHEEVVANSRRRCSPPPVGGAEPWVEKVVCSIGEIFTVVEQDVGHFLLDGKPVLISGWDQLAHAVGHEGKLMSLEYDITGRLGPPLVPDAIKDHVNYRHLTALALVERFVVGRQGQAGHFILVKVFVGCDAAILGKGGHHVGAHRRRVRRSRNQTKEYNRKNCFNIRH